MALFAREPFAGVGPREYGRLSDRQIVFLLRLGNRTRKGRLVTEARLRRGAAGGRRAGSLAAAGRDLPAPAALGLDEPTLLRACAINPRVPMSYLLLCFQVYRSRGLTAEEAFARYERVARGEGTSG